MTHSVPLRFISYTRVSTEDQAEYGTGLETQAIENAAYVLRIGATLIGSESDPGISGTIYPRPGLSRALDRLRTGEASALIVHRVDRLGRKLYIPPMIFEEVKALGCRLFSAEDGEVTDDNILLFSLRCGLAQVDHRAIVGRLFAGHRRQAEHGRQPNRVQSPFGYHIVKNVEDGRVRADAGTYEVIEEEARIVQEIFRRYVAGGSLLGIAKEFHREGVPAPQGGQWWAQVITKILQNPVYKGEAFWGKTTVRRKPRKSLPLESRQQLRGDPDGLTQITTQAPDHLRVTIAVPPLVTPAVWERVQQMRQQNAREGGTRNDRKHLFAGLMTCPTCRRRCRAESKAAGVYYLCPQARPSWSATGIVCNPISYKESDILAAVRSFLLRLRDSDLLEKAIRKQQQQQKPFQPEEYRGVVEALAALDKREAATAEAFAEAVGLGASREPFQRLFAQITAKRRELVAKREALDALRQTDQGGSGEEVGQIARAFAADALLILDDDDTTKADKNKILRQSVKTILPQKKGFGVELHIAPGLYLFS